MNNFHNKSPEIWFFLPEIDISKIPSCIEDFWQWQISSTDIQSLWGRYHWVLQTFLYFSENKINCQLTNKMPDEGIVITHRDCIPNDLILLKTRYIVCLLVDRKDPYPYANYHILHNPIQKLKLFKNFAYIPPWPQINLIPRDEKRGEEFKNVMFYGYYQNLISALRKDSFEQLLKSHGLNLKFIAPESWNDFSDCDVLLGIREFGNKNLFLNKPSLKLYNAWMAGIPAILGYESAYRYEGCINQDYLEATNYDMVVDTLIKLKENIKFRQEIISNGKRSAQNFLPEQTIIKWKTLLKQKIIPDYFNYTSNPYRQSKMKIVGRIREGLVWRYPLITK